MPSHALLRCARATGAGIAALLLLLLSAGPAAAHTQLVSMFPADGSTVTVAPARVVLTFDEDIQHIGDAIVVTAPDGTRVDVGAPDVQGPTATERLLPLTLRGHYSVSYRIVSDDGHPVTRTLGFELATGAAPTATHAPAPTPVAASSVRWPAVLVGLVLAGGLLWLWSPLRRRRP